MWLWLLAACAGTDTDTDTAASVDSAPVTDSATGTDSATEIDTASDFRTTTWTFGDDTVTVTVENPDTAHSTFTLTTTHPIRDDGPQSRTIEDAQDLPTLRSGSDLLDALFLLAVWEAQEASVSTITDASFNGGEPVPCDCFETGEQWPWVWTRDTAYAADLGLAWLDPERSWASLDFKLSAQKEALGGGLLQIVQDTGSGGSWPVSTDRVSWALGAARTLDFLAPERRAEVLPRAYEALSNTLVLNTRYAWDPADGLYRGEQSFLDWREQSYPVRTAADVVPIAASKALSTNVLHLEALRIAAEWAKELGHDPADWTAQADALQLALGEFSDGGLFRSVIGGPFDPSPTAQTDALGVALLARNAMPDVAAGALEALQFGTAGPAVIWPQQPFTPIYHNRAAWPFVTAYVARAERKQGNTAAFRAAFDALVRGAALNLSHMENFELTTGANHVEDGDDSGPVVNSRRQLWSVAAFLSVIVDGLLGLQVTDGVPSLDPFLPPTLLQDTLGDSLQLLRFPLQGAQVDLVAELSGLTGSDRDSGLVDRVIDEGDPDTLFAPVEPTLGGPVLDGGWLTLTLGDGGQDDVVLDVYRDGVRVAQDLAPGTWTDLEVDPTTQGACYTVRARHSSTDLGSQHPAASCWWGSGASRIQEHDATTFTAVGGTLVDNHGRWHHQDWGEPDHTLSVVLTPAVTGTHWLQAVYGNGSGPISTGITAATKWLQVHDSAGALVAEGPLVMPQTGDWTIWADSTTVPADLVAGETYTATLAEGTNMSWLAAHADYSGAGGGDASYGYVNIAVLKLLAMDPS